MVSVAGSGIKGLISQAVLLIKPLMSAGSMERFAGAELRYHLFGSQVINRTTPPQIYTVSSDVGLCPILSASSDLPSLSQWITQFGLRPCPVQAIDGSSG